MRKERVATLNNEVPGETFQKMAHEIATKYDFLEKDIVSLFLEATSDISPSLKPENMWDYAKGLTKNETPEQSLLYLSDLIVDVVDDPYFAGGPVKYGLGKILNRKGSETVKHLKEFIGKKDISWSGDSRLLRFTFIPHFLQASYNSSKRREIYFFLQDLGGIISYALKSHIPQEEIVSSLQDNYQLAPLIGMKFSSNQLLKSLRQVSKKT
ncbi:hypothetical protein HY502_00380 [Candidatus Woesebacteria bacterium]|nr:hypothetical protein [Candidatus Woesebacteria bacterium]